MNFVKNIAPSEGEQLGAFYVRMLAVNAFGDLRIK